MPYFIHLLKSGPLLPHRIGLNRIRRRPVRLLLTLLLCSLTMPLTAQPPLATLPPLAALQRGEELGINHHYDQALALFDSIAAADSTDPAGPFFRAAIYQSMMLDHESAEWQERFYDSIAEAAGRVNNQLRRDPHNPWARFFAGATFAYKSAQLSREGNYWPAWRAIRTSLGYLEPLYREDSTFCDALLGIGTWHYWRSRLTVNLSWLPFFPDRRSQGIAEIKHASQCARLSNASAWSNLAWIYIRENDYDQAIAYARLGLSRYPASRFFLWPLAEALFLKQAYAEALAAYTELHASVRASGQRNGYNELVILWKMAQCHEKLGQLEQARIHYELVARFSVAPELRGRAADKIKEARQWLEEDQRRN